HPLHPQHLQGLHQAGRDGRGGDGGCCWKATEKCASEAPPLVQVEGNKAGHLTACHYPETSGTVPAPRLSKDPEAAA
ncbi:hypothetical protein ACWCQV_35910, partial [Streptomyces eurythermus]